jgi:hypothetical protein
MKHLLLVCAIAFCFCNNSIAQEHHQHNIANANITPFNDAADYINGITGIQYNNAPQWQSFVQQYPQWGAHFKANNNMPHRAMGNAITLPGTNAQQVSNYLLNTTLAAYNIPTGELVLTSNKRDNKYININYKQVHNGMEVLFSRVTVRLTHQHKVVMFGADAYNDIQFTPASINSTQAVAAANAAISTPITHTTCDGILKLLPIPQGYTTQFVPVYAVNVFTQDTKDMDGNYYTLVNANTGTVIYRQNKVVSITHKVTGPTYKTNVYSPIVNNPLPYVRVTANGTNYNANANGVVTLPGTTPVNATITLTGPWCQIYNGASNTSPISNSTTMADGDSSIFDVNAAGTSVNKVNCYYHTNVIHDFLKNRIPTFTGLDVVLTTRVDRTDGSCNAFYNGSSINFYYEASPCNGTGSIADVVYHEYGHGITNRFWQDNGVSFDNGGMGEGYSDMWAMGLTVHPVIGPGFYLNNPTGGIRRYDTDNKVYPVDINGEVHNDGEIIAGAWWDTYVNWGDMEQTHQLFADSHEGLANGPDGAEGQVYYDILIDALSYDDIDNNINNGTPHFMSIVKGFAKHGIFLNMGATFAHNALPNQAANISTPVSGILTAEFPAFVDAIKVVYRNKPGGGVSTTQNTVSMTSNGNNTYNGSIPAQAAGTVLEYYFELFNNYDTANSAVSFIKNAEFSIGSLQRNLPYHLVYGMQPYITENFETTTATAWTQSTVANAGNWIVAVPIATSLSGKTVQTGADHTSGTGKCAVTGNNTAGNTSVGNADVDNGIASFRSPAYDITGFTKPVLSYYRWFSNSLTTNGNNRLNAIRVRISDNNGSTWKTIDYTFEPQVSWHRQVIRITDYVTKTNQFRFEIIVTDTAFNRQAIMEAALDDVEILDLPRVYPASISNLNAASLQAYPNPANNSINISSTYYNDNAVLQLVNTMGQVLLSMPASQAYTSMDVQHLSNGLYYLQLSENSKVLLQQKVMIMH